MHIPNETLTRVRPKLLHYTYVGTSIITLSLYLTLTSINMASASGSDDRVDTETAKLPVPAPVLNSEVYRAPGTPLSASSVGGSDTRSPGRKAITWSPDLEGIRGALPFNDCADPDASAASAAGRSDALVLSPFDERKYSKRFNIVSEEYYEKGIMALVNALWETDDPDRLILRPEFRHIDILVRITPIVNISTLETADYLSDLYDIAIAALKESHRHKAQLANLIASNARLSDAVSAQTPLRSAQSSSLHQPAFDEGFVVDMHEHEQGRTPGETTALLEEQQRAGSHVVNGDEENLEVRAPSRGWSRLQVLGSATTFVVGGGLGAFLCWLLIGK